jgi:phosphoribosylformimino-5-aminoimidazole carboxamide ribotide isomerase
MLVIPVLDLLGGVVVRGVAGMRSEYRPVVSCLSDRPEPLAVARAFRSELGLETLYVADLDAILSERPNWETYRQLALDGFSLWIDAGLREIGTAERLLTLGAVRVIAGLETWPGPESLAELCRKVGGERVIFSLDLKEGSPLGSRTHWPSGDARVIAEQAADAGVKGTIVLDLSQVGVNQGISTTDLCRQLRESRPGRELITGGGVRHADDLRGLGSAGIDGVLVASALHDGRVRRGDIERVSGESS